MLIDTHTHISSMLGFVMMEEMVLEMIDKYNISYLILSNADSAEYDHDQKPIPLEYQISQKDTFAKSIRFARENPGKIGIMPWVKPATETADETLERMIKDNLDIVKGIKMHAYHSKTATDDDRMIPYVELAQKYDLPVLIHTGNGQYDSVYRVYNMAKRYPEVKFILGHMGLGTDNKEAVHLLGCADNLYGDTAWVPMETTIEVIKKYGSKRMVFGSDSPIDGVDTYVTNGYGEPSMYRKYFEELEGIIGKEAYEDLMYKNAIELFKIKEVGETKNPGAATVSVETKNSGEMS